MLLALTIRKLNNWMSNVEYSNQNVVVYLNLSLFSKIS